MTQHGSAVRLDTIEDALEALGRGSSIVVVDDEGRENEGDMIFAASTASAEQTALMIRYTSGFICVGMEGEDLDRLNLPPMTAVNQDRKGTAYAVTVDARAVESTGISASDRAITIRTLGDPTASPRDFTRPGHVMPLRAVPGGVLRRPGHTEAAVDLARMAGLQPAGALCEMVNDDGTMMNAADCRAFCDDHGLVLVSIADLIRYRLQSEKLVMQGAQSLIDIAGNPFTVTTYAELIEDAEHLALVHGDIGNGEDVLVRVHVACVSGDVFGSTGCTCRERLEESLRLIGEAGRGVIVYLQPQVGRLADAGFGTGTLGPHAGTDELDYGIGSQILADLGVKSMVLLTTSPERTYRLAPFGLAISGYVLLGRPE